MLARKEAKRLNHNFLGTEHLLLGLIKLGQGTAVNVMQNLGLDLEIIRQEVEKYMPGGPTLGWYGNFPYTPRVKKVIALAQKEAKNLGHTYGKFRMSWIRILSPNLMENSREQELSRHPNRNRNQRLAI